MIRPGASIAVCAPCGVPNLARLDAGLQIARSRGFDVQLLPDMLQPHRYLAGPDAHRAAQLVEALTDPRWDAVWIARGGFGLTRLLDALPFERFAERPVIGFSDVTALFGAMHARGLGPCVHGPVVHSLPGTDEASLDALFDVLEGRPAPDWRGTPWVEGIAEGPVIGGNLCLLAATCGTPHQVDARGALLVLEEVGEHAYRVDRMLQQLVSAGVFDGVAGVLVGEMTGCAAPEGASWSIDDVLRDHLEPLGVPVLAGVPVGHGSRNHAFVWGRRASLLGDALRWSPRV